MIDIKCSNPNTFNSLLSILIALTEVNGKITGNDLNKIIFYKTFRNEYEIIAGDFSDNQYWDKELVTQITGKNVMTDKSCWYLILPNPKNPNNYISQDDKKIFLVEVGDDVLNKRFCVRDIELKFGFDVEIIFGANNLYSGRNYRGIVIGPNVKANSQDHIKRRSAIEFFTVNGIPYYYYDPDDGSFKEVIDETNYS